MTEQNEEKAIYHLEDDEFHQYFTRAAASNEDFEIKCYRVTRKGNKTYKTWLQDFIDECPTEQQIAEEYGGGRYWLVAWDTKNRKLEKTLWIDELWTRKLIESRRVDPGPPQSIQETRPDPLEYMSKIFEVMKPMLNMNGKNNSPNAMADLSTRMFEGMTNSMVESLGRIQTAVIDKQLEKLDAPPPEHPQIENDSMNDKMKFIREIIDMAKEFGSTLINSKGLTGKVMQTAIKQDERFTRVMEDPALYDALYTEAVNDPEIGKEKADKLFEKLGFSTGEAG